MRAGRRATLAWRELPGRRAADPRPGRGHRRVHRRGHRGGAPGGDPADRGHRGPADGRDERRRRPVRRRQDVPAPGRQERPGHEEGRRPPHPVSSRREREPGAARDRTAGSSWPRSRATSTTSARTSSASSSAATTTRSSTSASWSRPRGSSRPRARSTPTSSGCPGSSRRRSRRCATSPREMEREGFDDPAAHRRRDDVADPHRGQDRARVLRAGRPRRRRVAGGRRGRRARRRGPARRVRGRHPRGVRDGPPRTGGAREEKTPGTRSPRRAPTALAIDWTDVDAAAARRSSGVADDRRLSARRSSSSASTGRRSSRPGSCTAPIPRSCRDPVVGRGRAILHRDALAPARPDRRRAGACRRTRVVGFWPANTRRRRHRAVHRRATARRASARSTRCASRWSSRPAARTWPWPTSPRRARPGVADYVGAFAVTAGHGLDELVAEFEAANDDYSAILARALADRLAEAFAERLHEMRPARAVGLRPRRGAHQRRTSSPSATRASGRRPATRPARTTPRRDRCSSCSRREPRAGIELTESFAMLPGRVGQRLLLLAPAGRLLRARPDRPRPARGLRAPQGHDRRGRRALARPEPRRGLSQGSPGTVLAVPSYRETMLSRPSHRRSAASPRRCWSPRCCSWRRRAATSAARGVHARCRAPRGLRGPDELRPVRRRQHADDAEHDRARARPHREDPAPAPEARPWPERSAARRVACARARASSAGRPA